MPPQKDHRSLIRLPAQKAGKDLSADTVNSLLEFAGGHPFCLQVGSYYAYETPERWDEIRPRATRELEANFEYSWRNLNQLEQQVLANLPVVLARLAHDTTQAHILRDLTHKCLLVKEHNSYRFAYQAWANFVEAQILPRQAHTDKISMDIINGSRLGPYEIVPWTTHTHRASFTEM